MDTVDLPTDFSNFHAIKIVNVQLWAEETAPEQQPGAESLT